MAVAPYDTATTILNMARFRLNDKMNTIIGTYGKILDETDASTQAAFNAAYRHMQEFASDGGVDRFRGEIVIENIPVVTNYDPASQCILSWSGFFDGTTQQSSPVLPQDLIEPLWMCERPYNQNAVFPDPDNPNMYNWNDGIPMFAKRIRNFGWEWREDAIYIPGALAPVDFRIGYRSYLPDIADNTTSGVRWWNQPVPLMRCADALAWWICHEFAISPTRNGIVATQALAAASHFMEMAKDSTNKWINRDVMKNQRQDVRRVPYGGRNRSGYGRAGGWWF
jgi:hypothetical protein